MEPGGSCDPQDLAGTPASREKQRIHLQDLLPQRLGCLEISVELVVQARIQWAVPLVGIQFDGPSAYMRVVTNPGVFTRPRSVTAAWRQVEEWLACERVWIPVPGPAHRSTLAGLIANLGGGPKLIPDAHLAALAIEHGLTLCSTDGDFARFRGVRWINPLAS
jgi:hypothetical protein